MREVRYCEVVHLIFLTDLQNPDIITKFVW